MKRILIPYLFLLFSPLWVFAQGENNIWTFDASGGSDWALSFNILPVGITVLPVQSYFGFGAAVSYPNGQLRFIVRLTPNTMTSSQLNLFDTDGTPIAGSNLLTGLLTDGCMPVVIPRPGNADQYYIIYSYSNGLSYSLLDMSLNNGTGAIVTGQKDVTLTSSGTVYAEKMVAVPGCYGVWLVVRSRTANAYLSFHVTPTGIDTNSVLSLVGNFALSDYGEAYLPSHLKASLDGKHIGVCAWKGLELYDFEKCSGKLKNAQIIDTTGNLLSPSQSVYNNYFFRDICFSPDGSKLYATFNHMDGSNEPVTSGKLFQYDLSLPDPPAIVNSKTLVLTNQPSITPVGNICVHITPNPLGEMKLGPDGRIYVDNGSFTCLDPANVPAGYNPGAAFHTINQPNLSGMACQPQFNTVVVEGFNSNYGRSFYQGGFGGSALQQNIVTAPPPPDTVAGNVFDPVVCFKDSLVLAADSLGSCYLWDDQTTVRQRTVMQSGTYFVQYFKDCNYTTDTFHVGMTTLPVLHSNSSCPGMHMGRIVATADSLDHTMQDYVWKTSDGSILRHFASIAGDTIKGLDTGIYFLQLQTPFGCDTVITASITGLPKPELSVYPADTTIRYGDSILLHSDGALFYAWHPSGSLDSANKAEPVAKPLVPTLYSVIGINTEGCEDTGYVNIHLDYTMPALVPNAFSPNGDGLNDVFRIAGITYQKVVAFRIYNRFGQQVFTTMDGLAGWDGTQNGRPCDVGTYYYFIQLDFPDGSHKTYKGDVTLIR